QISKSEIININYIDHLKLNKNGTIEIRFTNNDFTYSSRRYLPLIKEALKL
ncbi:MAG: LytTR family DNA-binding domain-containing protein, partial [Staphylococcus xylosus]|nr:LytTR family DNA-binding domain-containing protein [Staphylococcus xylosus]